MVTNQYSSDTQRLVDTLKHDDVEVRRRLSEMTRRMTVLRVNEKALVRRHNTMEEIEDTLRRVRRSSSYLDDPQLNIKYQAWCINSDFFFFFFFGAQMM